MSGINARAVLLGLLAVMAYWNGLGAPFLLDDDTSIVTNTSIERLTLPGPLITPPDTPVARRPLVNLSFAITYALAERNVFWYHAGNLLIHILAAVTLFGIIRRTLILPPLAAAFGPAATSVAWVASLVWVLHPLNTEVIAYVTQRSQGMLGLFYLLTLYSAIRAGTERRGRRWTVASVACCMAGMLCKESMVTAPFVVLLYDRMFLFDSWQALMARRARLYTGLAASWVVLAVAFASAARTSAGFGSGATGWDYLLNQARLIPRYVYLSVWPRQLVVDYGVTEPIPLSAVVLPGALLVAALVLVGVGLWRRQRAAFPVAWFFVTLAPTSSIVPIATEVGAERRMYLPLAGLVVLCVASAYWATRRSGSERRWPRMVAAGVVVLLGIGTVARNREYADPLRLAETVVQRWPSGRAYVHLGMVHDERGDHELAIGAFRVATADYALAHYPLGVALVEQDQVDEGMAHLQTFIREAPNNPAVEGARDLIGRVLIDRGNFDAAGQQFEQSIAANAANARAVVLLAEVRLRQSRIDDAIALFERARQLDSGVRRDAFAMRRFATALMTLQRTADAERVLAEAAGANPSDVAIQKLWGRSLAVDGRFTAAAERFHQARRLAPGDTEARQLVEAIERRMGLARR